MSRPRRIVSGGQTGVDQAALEAARDLGLAIGGWCPPGRICEGGRIPAELPLRETPAERSPAAPAVARSLRTEWNVRDSDATLLLLPAGLEDPGCAWTRAAAEAQGRPLLVLDPFAPEAAVELRRWLSETEPRTLNVAGPSEASAPGIGRRVHEFLSGILSEGVENRSRD